MIKKRLGLKSGSPNHLKSGQMATMSKNHLESRQKCWELKWSVFQMVGAVAITKAQPFEIQP